MLKDEEIWKLVSFIKKLNEVPPAVGEAWKKRPGFGEPQGSRPPAS